MEAIVLKDVNLRMSFEEAKKVLQDLGDLDPARINKELRP